MIQKIKDFAGFTPDINAIKRYEIWEKLFIEYNSHTNLMSKNEIPNLFNKHVLDSLILNRLNEFKNGITLCDIGAGGGFPSVIISVFFPEINVICVESIKKKTNFLSLAKKEINLDNLTVINERSENIKPLFADIITNRAVGKIEKVYGFSKKHLKKGGIFVSYKANFAKGEAKAAKEKFKELSSPHFLEYELPIEEGKKRELVIFKV